MKVPLYSKKGNKKKEIVLNPAIYGARVNERLLALVHKAFAANLRRGTADTKVHKEVRGGGKKPWKQKGTGRARQGSIRAAQWKGGGVVFGPHPRDYTVHLPQAMRNKALISALSLRASQKNLILLEDVELETAKTKEWVGVIQAMPLQDKKTLCVVRSIGANLKRASQNLRNLVEIRPVNEMNAYHILQKEKLMIEEEALPMLEERLAVAAGSQEATSKGSKE